MPNPTNLNASFKNFSQENWRVSLNALPLVGEISPQIKPKLKNEFCLISAVSLVLDSLDDIHCLQEAPLKDRDFLHSVLDDRQLHALLEVSKSS